MLRQLEQIPYVKDLVKRLNRNLEMRLACGYGSKVPTEAHFSQMKKRVGVEGFRTIEEWLRHEALRLRESQPLSAVGLVQAACIDGTDFPAWSSRDPHDTRKGLGDPDARLGRGKNKIIDDTVCRKYSQLTQMVLANRALGSLFLPEWCWLSFCKKINSVTSLMLI
jgi:hypothetical protein